MSIWQQEWDKVTQEFNAANDELKRLTQLHIVPFPLTHPDVAHHLENVMVPINDRMYHLFQLKQQAKDQIIIAQVKQEIKKSQPAEAKDLAVTICPEESSSHTFLFDIIERIKDEPHILSGKYVLEQRSKHTEPEQGWHLHLIIQSTQRASKMHQFITQRLKKRPTVNAFVVVKPCFNSGWLNNYMDGKKGSDPDKLAKSEKDKLLRAKYNLQDFYLLK